MLLQSLPFEINMKSNGYLTITETVSASFYRETPKPVTRDYKCKFQVFLPLNTCLIVKTSEDCQIKL